MTVITIHQRAECKSKKVSALDQYERIATYRAPARAKFEDQGRKTGAGGKSGFDLIKELYIGRLDLDKTKALDALLRTAHLARDRALVRKAMDKWRQHSEENMYEDTDERFEAFEERLAQWSRELKSNRAPEKREIDFFFRISFSDSPHLM